MSDSDEDRNNRHTRFHITGSWRLERATAGNEFMRVFDYSEGAIIVSGKGRRMLIDRSESLWGFFNEILTRCEQQDNPTEPEWLTKLRKEVWHAAMKDKFWLSRDEVFHLIDSIPEQPSPLRMTTISPAHVRHYQTSQFGFLPPERYPWKANTTR